MEQDYLEFLHITKNFPGVTALDDVSMSVHRGEIHALVGENGAGKSTLMNILGGNLQPNGGELRNGFSPWGAPTGKACAGRSGSAASAWDINWSRKGR